MPDRLSPLDSSFLFMEELTTAMHVGGLMTFEPRPRASTPRSSSGSSAERLAAVPRYRQKIREVPGRVGLPVWVDDPRFDLALPRPPLGAARAGHRRAAARARRPPAGSPARPVPPALGDLPGRGPRRRRFAVITKTHHAMVDGLASVDIGAVLLDVSRTPRESPPDTWSPRPEPSSLELVVSAVADQLRRPQGWSTPSGAPPRTRAPPSPPPCRPAGAVLVAARNATRTAPANPLNAAIGQQRRYATSAGELDDYKAIRKEHGGTVNDVVLAVVAGGLRRWLLNRGEPVLRDTVVRAMVPVSVRAAGSEGELGNRVSAYFVDLPVGEPDPSRACR